MKKKFQFSEHVMKKIYEVMARVGQTDFEKFVEEDLYYERVVLLRKSDHITASHEVGVLKKQVDEFKTKVTQLTTELNLVHSHLLQLQTWLHPSQPPKQNTNNNDQEEKDGKMEEEDTEEEDEESKSDPEPAPRPTEKLVNLDRDEDDEEEDEDEDEEDIGNPPFELPSDLLVKGFTTTKQHPPELWTNSTSQQELDSIILDSPLQDFPKRCTGENWTYASKWLHQFAFIKTEYSEGKVDFAALEEEARNSAIEVYVKTGGRPCFVFRFTNQDGLAFVDLIHPITHCLEHGTRFQQSICTAKNRCKIGTCSNKHPCKLSNIITSCGCARVEDQAIRSLLEFPKIPQKIYN